MSINYAAGLSPYENKGKCGMPEFFDSPDEVNRKSKQLAEMIRSSRHCIVNTGAGVSTAAGIPDFRGPNGVWTLENRGELPNFSVTFDEARPTLTHMGLKALEERGFLKLLITQNVDGLHLRSGFPMDRLAELHGNMFVEECVKCRRKQVQPNAVASVGLKLTGNACNFVKSEGRLCRGKMRDSILDWEDNLPERDLFMADHHSKITDLNICLGTSLQIVPAGSMPLYCKQRKRNGKLVIANLQKTKHDAKADLVVHAKIDEVIRIVCEHLSVPIPEYVGPQIIEHSSNGPAEIPQQLLPKPARKRNVNNREPESEPTAAKWRDSCNKAETAVAIDTIKSELKLESVEPCND